MTNALHTTPYLLRGQALRGLFNFYHYIYWLFTQTRLMKIIFTLQQANYLHVSSPNIIFSRLTRKTAKYCFVCLCTLRSRTQNTLKWYVVFKVFTTYNSNIVNRLILMMRIYFLSWCWVRENPTCRNTWNGSQAPHVKIFNSHSFKVAYPWL
jgi:hypothetical protein